MIIDNEDFVSVKSVKIEDYFENIYIFSIE